MNERSNVGWTCANQKIRHMKHVIFHPTFHQTCRKNVGWNVGLVLSGHNYHSYILCFRITTQKLKKVWKYCVARFLECPLNIRNNELSTSNMSFKSKQAFVYMERFKCQRRCKCFERKSKLARHEALHGLTKLGCDKCGKIFSRKDNTMIHQRKKHKIFSCNL